MPSGGYLTEGVKRCDQNRARIYEEAGRPTGGYMYTRQDVRRCDQG